MYTQFSGFLHENAPMARQSTEIRRAFWRKLHHLAGKSVQRRTQISPWPVHPIAKTNRVDGSNQGCNFVALKDILSRCC